MMVRFFQYCCYLKLHLVKLFQQLTKPWFFYITPLLAHSFFSSTTKVKPSTTSNELETTTEEMKQTTVEAEADINCKNLRKKLIFDNSLNNNENSVII